MVFYVPFVKWRRFWESPGNYSTFARVCKTMTKHPLKSQMSPFHPYKLTRSKQGSFDKYLAIILKVPSSLKPWRLKMTISRAQHIRSHRWQEHMNFRFCFANHMPLRRIYRMFQRHACSLSRNCGGDIYYIVLFFKGMHERDFKIYLVTEYK